MSIKFDCVLNHQVSHDLAQINRPRQVLPASPLLFHPQEPSQPSRQQSRSSTAASGRLGTTQEPFSLPRVQLSSAAELESQSKSRHSTTQTRRVGHSASPSASLAALKLSN